MFENISILIPYTSDNELREKNWNWIKNRYELLMPDAEICIGESYKQPYSRSESINNAAKKATREIFLITDADIVFDINDLYRCLDMLKTYKWIIPYSKLIKFNRVFTREILSYDSSFYIHSIELSESNSNIFFDSSTNSRYQVIGGICIIRREHFYECGGFDERFRGWGGEDDAFSRIVKYLYKEIGRPLDMTVYHLFHESSPRNIACYEKNKDLLKTEYAKNKDFLSVIKFIKDFNSYN